MDGNGVSLAVGVVALVFAALTQGLPEPKWWKKIPGLNKIPWGLPWLNFVLVCAGSVAVLASGPGLWVHDKVTYLLSVADEWLISYLGVGLALLIAIGLSVYLAVQLAKPGPPDSKAMATAAAVAFFSSSIPGVLGVVVLWVFGLAAWIAGGFIGWGTGLA